MSDLLQEVDDALRREKAEKFWRDNGSYIVGGAVLLVLMTGVFTFYNSWQQKNNARQTSVIVQALQVSVPEDGLNAALKDLKGSHKAMAMLQIAGLKAQKGNNAEALTLFKQVAEDSSLPALWRDLATLNAARAEWSGPVDKERGQALLDSVKPLTVKTNPWHLQASLLAAMIAGDTLGDREMAVQILRGPLSDAAAPPAIKEKAKILDHLYLNTNLTAGPAHNTASDKANDKPSIKPAGDKAAPKG